MTRRVIGLACASAVLIFSVPTARAQPVGEDPFEERLVPAEVQGSAPAPELRFTLVAEIPLPGPLPGAAPRIVEGQVEVTLADGVAVMTPGLGAVPEIRPAVPADPLPPPDDGWAVDPRGVFRFRSNQSGEIVAERRCPRCSDGWKKRWKLRIPGRTTALPLALEDRVYFGALDNLVYCVKSKNGHRVWVAEAGGRLTRPLVAWNGPPRVILVVPDSGNEILALDADLGRRVARVQFAPESGEILGQPAVTADGLIVAAYDKYAPTEASLLVYRLESPTPNGADPGMHYNDPLEAAGKPGP